MLFGIEWVQWLGYLASVLVAVSLMMSSVLKLRFISLLGGAIFSTYGFLIEAYPVAFLNAFIVFINAYYIIKMYSAKEFFKILETEKDSKYLKHFLSFHSDAIKKDFPDFEYKEGENIVSFYLLRDLVPAGVFIGEKLIDGTLLIHLDFVIPQYRDFKLGHYFYLNQEKVFYEKGYKRFKCYSSTKTEDKYFLKMGFEEVDSEGKEKVFVKEILGDA